MEEELEQYPSLPANYVSLKMLKELRQKEKEEKERKQKEKEEEEERRRSEEEEERRLKEEEEEKIREEQRKLLDSPIKTSVNRPYRNLPRRFAEKKVEQQREREIGSSAENPKIVDGVNGDRKEGEGRHRDALIRTDFNRPYRRNNRGKFEKEVREVDLSKDPVVGESKPRDVQIKTSFNRLYRRNLGRVENKEREIDSSENLEEELKISVVNGGDETLKENAVRKPRNTRRRNRKNRGKSEEKGGEIDSSNTLEEELDVVVVNGEAGEGKIVKPRKKTNRRKWGEKSKERKEEAAGEGDRNGEKEKQPIESGGDDGLMPMNPTVKNPANDDCSKDEVKEATTKINSGLETTSVNQTVKITSRIGNLTLIDGNVVVRNIEKRNRSKVEMNGGGPNEFRGFRGGGYGHGGRLGGSGREFRDGGRGRSDGNFTWVPKEDIK